MPRPRSFRSSYEVMYLVPSYLWDSLKKCVNSHQRTQLDHLNKSATEEQGVKALKADSPESVYLASDSLPAEDRMDQDMSNVRSNTKESEAESDANPPFSSEGQDEDQAESLAIKDIEEEEESRGKDESPRNSEFYKCSECKAYFLKKQELQEHKLKAHLPAMSNKGKKKMKETQKAAKSSKSPKAAKKSEPFLGAQRKRKRRDLFDEDSDEEPASKKKVSVNFRAEGDETMSDLKKPRKRFQSGSGKVGKDDKHGKDGKALKKIPKPSFKKWL